MKLLTTLAALALTAAAHAQFCDVSDTDKFAWGENIGWLNFRDAGTPAASGGLVVLGDHVGGWVWGENVGWISLGASTSSIDGPYSNATGPTHGVNLNPATGALTGYAWGENIGWINFGGGALATPAKPARIDFAARRLRGCAWGENVGWINLDDGTSYVGLRCPADFDGSGFVNGVDFDEFVEAFYYGLPEADFDRSTFVNGVDFDSFIEAFVAGC